MTSKSKEKPKAIYSGILYAIYSKENDKKWKLFSTTFSQEAASKELEEAIKISKNKGIENVKSALKTYDSFLFDVPYYLDDIKEEKILFN